jgi:TetR/AcrR family transcriptional regulator, transcriptional repressor for nem operon
MAQTRDKLIRTGVEFLTEKGFVATGLDGLLKAARVPKGSFYYYFDSKEDFGLKIIEAYAAYFNAKLNRCLNDRDLSSRDRIRNFMDDARSGMIRHDFRRGCLVGNLGQELTVLPEQFRRALNDVMRQWEARMASCLNDDYDADTAQNLAVFFWIGWEGAVLRARLERSVLPLDVFGDGFLTLLEKK